MGIVTKKVQSAKHSVVDGVVGKVCGAGRKQNRSGSFSCLTWQPLSNYATNNAYEDGKAMTCRDCEQKRRKINAPTWTVNTPKDKALAIPEPQQLNQRVIVVADQTHAPIEQPDTVAQSVNTDNVAVGFMRHMNSIDPHLRVFTDWMSIMYRAIDQTPGALESLDAIRDAMVVMANAAQQRKTSSHGWIYILHDPRNRRYKIGMTQNPDKAKRQKEVEGIWGRGQSVQVAWIETDNIALEKRLHACFRKMKRHISDEWFRLSDTDITRIRLLGSFVRFADFDDALLMDANIQSSLLDDFPDTPS